MVLKYSDITPSSPAPGVTRRVLSHGGTMMAVEVTFEKGAVGAPHSHPHEQVCYVASGKFEYTAEGETHILTVGDTYYAAPNITHGAVALEAGVLVDIFTPQREDFL